MIRPERVIPCMREWFERSLASIWRPPPATPKQPKQPLVWTDATDEERLAMKAIASVRYQVGSWDKRFARKIQAYEKLTDGQREQIWRIAARYHRQLPQSIVLIAKQRMKEHSNERS